MPAPETNDLTGLDDDKLFAALSYLTVLVVVPLLLRRDDPFVAFHTKQGLVLLVALVVAFLVNTVLPLVGNVLVLVLLILDVVALVQALLGRRWNIPLIGSLARRITI